MYQGVKPRIPIGRMGFVNSSNIATTPIEGAIQAENLQFTEGSVQRRFGNIKYNTTPLSGVIFVCGVHYEAVVGTKRLVVNVRDGSESKLLKDNGTGTFSTVLKSGLAMGVTPNFLLCGNEAAGAPVKLFHFNGVDPVQVLSGDSATTANLSLPPADWGPGEQPTFGALHRNAVWAGGNLNDRHRIYKSAIGNHQDFTTTPFSISIFPGEGIELTGAISYNGRLFFFKRPAGIYWLDDASTDSTQWSIKKLVDTIGLINPACLCVSETDVVFVGPGPELYTLSAVQEFGEVRPRNMLEEFGVDRWLRENYSRTDTDFPPRYVEKLRWHPRLRKLVFTFNASGGRFGELALDYHTPPIRVGYSFRDPNTFNEILNLDDGEHSLHGRTGTLYIGDQTSRAVASLDNGAWSSKYQIPHTSFDWVSEEIATNRKGLDWLVVETVTFDQQVILCDVYLDGVYRYTITFDFTSYGGSLIGTGLVGSFVLGGAQTFTRSKRLRGTCQRVSFLFYANDANSNFVLNDVQIWFRNLVYRQRQG